MTIATLNILSALIIFAHYKIILILKSGIDPTFDQTKKKLKIEINEFELNVYSDAGLKLNEYLSMIQGVELQIVTTAENSIDQVTRVKFKLLDELKYYRSSVEYS